MTNLPDLGHEPDDIAAFLLRLSPEYGPTPLLDLPRLAAGLNVAQVLAKNESRRALGSFKSLGGTFAGLRALARASGVEPAELIEPSERSRALPTLLCASDGNHGLAVAAGARYAGGQARIYLHAGVGAARARCIADQGADIVWVDGTYDDAVAAAAAAAADGEGLLVADTTDDPDDAAVADVMAGYRVMGREIRRQVDEAGHGRPTHLFVQAGVGGLAAAMALELKDWMAPPAELMVVEPVEVACVGAALAAGRIVRLPGDLHTAAEMLSCGEASLPALRVLQKAGARGVAVSEEQLHAAVALLAASGGPMTTASGATGLAGLAALRSEPRSAAATCGLDAASRVLLILTEGPLPA